MNRFLTFVTLLALSLCLSDAALAAGYWQPEQLPKQNYSRLKTYTGRDTRKLQGIADRSAPMRPAAPIAQERARKRSKIATRQRGIKNRYAKMLKPRRVSPNGSPLLASEASAVR